MRLTPHAHTYIRTVKYLLSRFCLLLAWKIKKQAEGNTCGKELDERTTTKQQEKQNKTNQLRASGEKQNKTVKNLHAKAEIIIILSPVCVCVCVFRAECAVRIRVNNSKRGECCHTTLSHKTNRIGRIQNESELNLRPAIIVTVIAQPVFRATSCYRNHNKNTNKHAAQLVD